MRNGQDIYKKQLLELQDKLSLDLIEYLKVLWVELPIHERLDTASPEEFATKILAMLKRKN
ncbi:hypothetical protein [Candidatus Odyssella thessalonicensis]|uniref:hypothetical protein n=1 Tax=Candidatus Odyssella thessalonicensis TaxID=84647 RepID=UPI000225B1D9|nr:hypothetical protein [Candidatus Odyssella thessalonicensis]